MSVVRQKDEKKVSFLKRNQKVIEIVVFSVLCVAILILFYSYFMQEKKTETTVDTQNNTVNQTAEKLSDILSKIKGVGEVDILITYADEGTKVIAYETVISGDGEVVTTPVFASGDVVVLSEQNPTIQGVIVVAQGASSITVRNDILNAVATGLKIDRNIIQIYEKGE